MPRKYSSKLITASLLNSFGWYNNCPPSWRDKALFDLTSYLNRAPFEPNDYMKLGEQFEGQVRKLTQGMKVADPMPTAKQMAERVSGGAWQVTCKGYMTINEQSYIFYGKIDVLKPGEILDIKTTQEFKGEDRYLQGTQHLLYLYAAHSQKWKHDTFRYLVTDFSEIHEVEFSVGDWDLLTQEVYRRVTDLLGFLKAHPDLEKAYNTVFCR